MNRDAEKYFWYKNRIMSIYYKQLVTKDLFFIFSDV